MKKFFCVIFLAVFVSSCASTQMAEQFQKGKMTFQAGYFKKAFRQLLPVAVAGNPEAEYAIGYMYYYGYGPTQDTESGLFWMRKAAANHFPPAIKALNKMGCPLIANDY